MSFGFQFLIPLLLAALAVSPVDRLAMADRLFGRGEFAAARREYLALKGEKGIDEADLLYRLAASAEGLKDAPATLAAAQEFLAKHSSHALADRVRLMQSLASQGDERKKLLSSLDRDDADSAIRAEALFHLARITEDAALYDRCRKIDPKGRYAPYAAFKFASHCLSDKNPAVRRRGLAELMEIVYGNDPALAKDALYLSAVHSYREGRYGESVALLRRYAKAHPDDSRAAEVRRLTALSELMSGHYTLALSFCADDKDETLLFVKALANERLGNKEAAASSARKYLGEFPTGANVPAVKLMLARMDFDEAVRANDLKKALEQARLAVSTQGSTSADKLRLAWAFEGTGETEKAEDIYSSIAREHPGSVDAAEAMYRRAMSLLRKEKWQSAELSLSEAMATGALQGGKKALAAYWRGVASIRAGYRDNALKHLRAALEEGLPLDEAREAKILIADADYESGRIDEAKKAYRLLVKEGALVRMSAAKTLAVGKLLDGEEAKICAQALVKSDSPQWRQAAFALLGKIEEGEGAYGAAIYSYTKAMEESCVTESLSSVALRLGVLEYRGGDLNNAEKALKRAVELNPADGEARAEAYLTLSLVALQRKDVESARAYATVVTALFDKTKFAAEAEKILKENPEEGR